MPTPPADRASGSSTHAAGVVDDLSPREAARRAIIYRRTRKRAPERGLRLAGLLGTLLVHMLVLFGMVLGSAYDLEPINLPAAALQVRLIDKPEPPPPPPVRGTPPKRRGPLHRAMVSAHGAANPNAVARRATPGATSQHPSVLTASRAPTNITPAPAAARPLASLPQPQPSPTLAPVPLAGGPPQITLATPPMTQPVPPAFQPEPIRKPQREGNRPLSSPPSLAMPDLPAQALPAVAPPSIALDRPRPVSSAPPASLPLVRPLPAPAIPLPDREAVPLPATLAPVINLQPTVIAPTPAVAREQPRVQAAAVVPDQSQLAAIPLADQPAPEQQAPPRKLALDIGTIAPVQVRPTIERPQLSAPEPQLATAATAGAPADAAPIARSEAPASATQAVAAADNAKNNPSAETDVSTAPDASPQASDTAAPGQPNGASNATADQTSASSAPGSAHGNGEQAMGQSGKPQPGADRGQTRGQLGSYVQLRPHGDTAIMSHGTPDIGYKSTRFAQDWTPEGESSIDTALRHAVEKTTVQHIFHLPRGVRVECKVMPLLPMALFGCGSADPPPKLVAEKVYERLDLAPVKPLASSPAPARSIATPAAIQLDNSAACAAARISGGPPPPGCAAPDLKLPPPPRGPVSGSTSWVPSSDQFH